MSGGPICPAIEAKSCYPTATRTPVRAGVQLANGGDMRNGFPSCTPAFAGVRYGCGPAARYY